MLARARHRSVALALGVALAACGSSPDVHSDGGMPPDAHASSADANTAIPDANQASGTRTVGLLAKTDAAEPGYTLFTPMGATTSYLIDIDGQRVHSWPATQEPGLSTYLLPGGTLLRTAKYSPGPDNEIRGSGGGGRVELVGWDGDVQWSFERSDAQARLHHDVAPLPNGNILMIAWERKTAAQAIAAGRAPTLLSDGELWPDHLIEVATSGPLSGQIVWEWHVWDHLVQDHDDTKPNFGQPSAFPGRIDVNYVANGNASADWNHANAVAYNPDLDQIVLSVRRFSEVWVIDHSTTTAEAASESGGTSGRGGALLYRWGNPAAWSAGSQADQQLGGQHDAEWIPSGFPGAGNLLVFDNGFFTTGGPAPPRSRIVELIPPLAANGLYTRAPGMTYGPLAPDWTYASATPGAFYADRISGSQRLRGGNTLICDGPLGRLFEVTPAGETVWDYVNPVAGSVILAQDQVIPETAAGRTNRVFRVERYAADDPALTGRDLTPKGPIELPPTGDAR